MIDAQCASHDEATKETETVESRIDADDDSLSSSRNIKLAEYGEGGWHESCQCQTLHCSRAIQQRGRIVQARYQRPDRQPYKAKHERPVATEHVR